MKTCFKCGQSKPVTEFYAHPQMGDGLLGKCKACTRRDTAERVERLSKDPRWALMERRRHREKSRRYREAGCAKYDRSMKRVYLQSYRNKHPQKALAHRITRRAIKSGVLVPKPCRDCGAKAQGHHPDYSRPLHIIWLCPRHHAEEHNRLRDAALVSQISEP